MRPGVGGHRLCALAGLHAHGLDDSLDGLLRGFGRGELVGSMSAGLNMVGPITSLMFTPLISAGEILRGSKEAPPPEGEVHTSLTRTEKTTLLSPLQSLRASPAALPAALARNRQRLTCSPSRCPSP